MDLKSDIFYPVVERIRQRVDSLRKIKRFKRVGIEGWFKVVAALGEKIEAIKSRGLDLLLKDGTKIELKAATDLHKGFFINPIRKYEYQASCLFLGDGTNPNILTKNSSDDIEIVAYEVISDEIGDWIIGLVKPRKLMI